MYKLHRYIRWERFWEGKVKSGIAFWYRRMQQKEEMNYDVQPVLEAGELHMAGEKEIIKVTKTGERR